MLLQLCFHTVLQKNRLPYQPLRQAYPTNIHTISRKNSPRKVHLPPWKLTSHVLVGRDPFLTENHDLFAPFCFTMGDVFLFFSDDFREANCLVDRRHWMVVSNILNFHPEPWGDFLQFDFRIFFRWVGSTAQLQDDRIITKTLKCSNQMYPNPPKKYHLSSLDTKQEITEMKLESSARIPRVSASTTSWISQLFRQFSFWIYDKIRDPTYWTFFVHKIHGPSTFSHIFEWLKSRYLIKFQPTPGTYPLG